MLLDLLKKRNSARHFSDEKISEGILEYILECGRLAPSGGNEQPWKFGVITNPELIRQIANESYYNQKWMEKAPLLIVLCTQLFPDFSKDEITKKRFPSFSDDIKADDDLFIRIDMEENQVKIPGTHMILAALEHGIGSTWVSFLNCEEVGKILGLNGYVVSNVIAMGYPQKDKPMKNKKPLEEVIFYNHFR